MPTPAPPDSGADDSAESPQDELEADIATAFEDDPEGLENHRNLFDNAEADLPNPDETSIEDLMEVSIFIDENYLDTDCKADHPRAAAEPSQCAGRCPGPPSLQYGDRSSQGRPTHKIQEAREAHALPT